VSAKNHAAAAAATRKDKRSEIGKRIVMRKARGQMEDVRYTKVVSLKKN